MSISSRGCGITGLRRRYCGFVFAGRSRREGYPAGLLLRGIALRQRKAKPPGFRTNSLRTPDEFEAQLSRILPLKGQNPPGALCLPLPKSYRLSDERPSGYHSLLLRSNSFRPDSPSTTNFPTGTEDSEKPTHHTGHGPFRTRPPNLS